MSLATEQFNSVINCFLSVVFIGVGQKNRYVRRENFSKAIAPAIPLSISLPNNNTQGKKEGKCGLGKTRIVILIRNSPVHLTQNENAKHFDRFIALASCSFIGIIKIRKKEEQNDCIFSGAGI